MVGRFWTTTAATLLVAASPALADIDVRVAALRGFSDVESAGSGRPAGDVAAQLAAHLRRLAARDLPHNLDLTVEITDVDLAGEALIGTGANYGVRVVTENTPPRIRLRWTLRDGRRVLTSGAETLTDPFFTWNPARGLRGDPLDAEKALLTTWFGRRIAQRRNGEVGLGRR